MNSEIHKFNKEQLMKTLLKKRECDIRAQQIVESLLDRHIAEDDFMKKIQNINQCHYNDVVEERHILRICSYPLCSNIIETVPAKRFQISTLTNKVYDITERKKFCSSHCHKASEYIKSQISTSPLWLRYQETPPKFNLLKCMKDENNL